MKFLFQRLVLFYSNQVVPKLTTAECLKDNFESVNVQLSVADFDQVNGLERNYRNSVAAFCVLPNGSSAAKSICEE